MTLTSLRRSALALLFSVAATSPSVAAGSQACQRLTRLLIERDVCHENQCAGGHRAFVFEQGLAPRFLQRMTRTINATEDS